MSLFDSNLLHKEIEEEAMIKLSELVKQVISQMKAKKEAESPAHVRLRQELARSREHVPGFIQLGKTGVIYVMSRAKEFGHYYGNEEWANFGQGAPETGHIEGQPDRSFSFVFNDRNAEYAAVDGVSDLRQKVADMYNELYRKDKESKYTAKNVCICPGGRAALSRLAASMGNVNVGFFLPDYTAYEQILSVFTKFVPIPHSLNNSSCYKLSYEELKKEIKDRGLSVILSSNPGNPTGALIERDQLNDLVSLSRKYHCSFILDEFYSHFIYTNSEEEAGRSVSSAEFIEDVDKDPIIIVNGLTKNWRLPGWRICWVVGPKELIESIQSSGSFIDGGANHPLQDAVVSSNILDPTFVREDAKVLQRHFKEKRDLMLRRLEEMGICIEYPPEATFYIWANLSLLPPPLDNGIQFFEEALTEKVICVPGIFFDVNPGKRRELFYSPYHHYVRLSFGPPMAEIIRGLDAIERLINKHKAKLLSTSN